MPDINQNADPTDFHPSVQRAKRLYDMIVKAVNAVPDTDSERKVIDYLLGAGVAEQEIGASDASATIKAQAAEISRLRDALKPFAEAAEGIDDSNPDRWEMWEHPASMNIHVADMRRARTALEANHG